jgi:hypothetical protein
MVGRNHLLLPRLSGRSRHSDSRAFKITTCDLEGRARIDRFPDDFLLRLTNQEVASLRSHFAILKAGRGQHRKYPPLAFTEHGAVMAATILSSPRAAAMSVYIVRAFVRLRSMLETNAQLARKLDALEKSFAVMDADTKRQFKELRAVVFALASPPAKVQ